MKGLRLYKKEKLCSAVAIDSLFSRGSGAFSALSYPVRAVWRKDDKRRSDAPIAFVISVPKKRLRHAVDRVTMRRRIREAYRLCRPSHPLPADTRLDVAFIYVADRLTPYSDVNRAVNRIMERIAASLNPLPANESPEES
ncbi:MAG: ribonuclease P protein component [Muribaculaceae bacterium]|nr:ribonuclease P protein component [Muribaculaceae bacterium]